MADFDAALKIIRDHEGGFVNNPKDPGGATKYGISLRFLESLPKESLVLYGIKALTPEAVKALTDEQIHDIYYHEFWVHLAYGSITSQKVANYIFDMAINHGPGNMARMLASIFPLPVPHFAAMVKQMNKLSAPWVVQKLREVRKKFVENMCIKHPNMEWAKDGLINRCNAEDY